MFELNILFEVSSNSTLNEFFPRFLTFTPGVFVEICELVISSYLPPVSNYEIFLWTPLWCRESLASFPSRREN